MSNFIIITITIVLQDIVTPTSVNLSYNLIVQNKCVNVQSL